MRLKSLFLLCTTLFGCAAFAQSTAAEPGDSLAFNVGVTSDYRFRGLTQSRFDPALQAGADFSLKSGFYLGAWASSVKSIKDAGGSADAEIDLYGGYKGALGDVGYDLGLLRYQYPGHKLAVGPNTTELYGAVSLVPVSANYSHCLTNTFGFANSKNSGYLELNASFDLGNGWGVAPHVGRQRINGTGNSIFSYTDYVLALSKDFSNGLDASVAAVGTNAPFTSYAVPGGKRQGRDGLALGLKFNL